MGDLEQLFERTISGMHFVRDTTYHYCLDGPDLYDRSSRGRIVYGDDPGAYVSVILLYPKGHPGEPLRQVQIAVEGADLLFPDDRFVIPKVVDVLDEVVPGFSYWLLTSAGEHSCFLDCSWFWDATARVDGRPIHAEGLGDSLSVQVGSP